MNYGLKKVILPFHQAVDIHHAVVVAGAFTGLFRWHDRTPRDCRIKSGNDALTPTQWPTRMTQKQNRMRNNQLRNIN